MALGRALTPGGTIGGTGLCHAVERGDGARDLQGRSYASRAMALGRAPHPEPPLHAMERRFPRSRYADDDATSANARTARERHRLSAGVSPPGKPDDSASTAAHDAYRQTQFVLGADLRLFAEGMNLQLRILNDSSHSRYRTHAYAAVVGTWSRAYTAMADACLLVTRGSYASAPNLVRGACELIAAEYQLHHEEMGEFVGWMLGHLKPDEEHKAFDVRPRPLLRRHDARRRPAAARGVPRRERPRTPELRRDAAWRSGRNRTTRGWRTPSTTRRSTSAGPRSSWAGCCASASASSPSPSTCATC